MENKVFDTHLHIIDPAHPLQENNGYMPEPFTVADYQERIEDSISRAARWSLALSKALSRDISSML